ncbi:ABC transporter ATP-binding protein [Paenibacillus baekrokdamisoli]|uniref:ABC transporter ATP-binding protein n=1 Tax=Paenibacillus baekrokdamisoli TaxID=1712516 RepID=A0A3G9JEZ7_9BACL|nr:sugar ABC transporter ATP-binding protein [Paenibacillus baekrokdamisoli]MBB3071478.1 simple sugar transport system ATP-binding protein [Paenibacillus baekrokdamisoli]BBH24491.1 ABC transporter ATP-binding protein [Paenibacillus baekrokdamisoli]
MLPPIISAKNITKSYMGVKALDDVSVTINLGEILCLAGENGSGKSTFVKTIAGVVTPDSGEILFDDTSYRKLTPIQAIDMGVQVIYQDLSLFPHMSVAENIVMNRMVATRKRLVNWKEINRIAEEQLQRIQLSLDLRASVESLSVANRQLVAICRALSQNAKVLFMDEPTTALTKKEVDRLLSIVMDLKAKGLSVVFISHKFDEIFEISDQITIFREGKKTGDYAVQDLDHKSLSFHMTGRQVEFPRYKRIAKDDTPLLEVRNLKKSGHYENINFTVRRGDILGIIGLLGSGRTELALSLFGLNPIDSGEIRIKGKPSKIASPADAVGHGIALLPEDRHSQGLFMKQSVKENISSTIHDQLKMTAGFIDRAKQTEVAANYVSKLRIRTHDVDTPIRNLSGGNQQKAVIAKWVVTNPELFILDTPTVGIDIGSKSEIYEQIHSFTAENMGVILISDELDEIMANCNKLLIMYDGRIVEALSEEELEKSDAREYILRVMSSPGQTSDQANSQEKVGVS